MSSPISKGRSRRMLDFCGLEFEEACLRFDENASPVATASAAQVRQPIYASSVGAVADAIGRRSIPALRMLVEGGAMDGKRTRLGRSA